MLNFLVQLTNKIGLPILLVGTPPAIQLLSADLMTSRRSAGQQGVTYLKPLEKDSLDWEIFFRGIWRYQWTAEKTKRTQELQDKLCSLSRGNIDMAMKLFMEAQRIAIDRGRNGYSETITPEILDKAASQDAFKIVLNRLMLDRGESIQIQKKKAKNNAIEEAKGPAAVAMSAEKSPCDKADKASSIQLLKGKAFVSHMAVNGQLVSPLDDF